MATTILTGTAVSSSLASTGSFGAIHLTADARIGFGTTTPGQAIDLRDGRVIMNNNYGYTQRDAAGNTATLLNQDGNDILKVGDANHTDTIKLQTSQGLGIHISTGGIIMNQDGDDINFRVESNNDTHALFIDGGKDSVSIGSNAADNNNHEKLTVAGNVGVTGSLHVSGNISTSGSIIAKEFRTEFVNQIIATSSGSTEFGDSIDDVHNFTGSIEVSGTLNIPTGSITVEGGIGGSNIARFSRNQGTTRTDIDIHAGSGDPQITFTTPSRDFSIGASAGGHEFRISEHTAIGTNNRLIVRDDGDVFISQSLDFRAEHAADKIVLYNGGNEKIGTSAHTMILTAASHSFKDTDGHENLTITPVGDLVMLATGKLRFDGSDAGHTYIHESSGDTLDFVVGGQQMLRMFEGGTDQISADDNVRLGVGSSQDLMMYHDGTDSYITNATGDTIIRSNSTNDDIFIQCDDGGSVITAMQIDASAVGNVLLPNDNQYLKIGASNDFSVYHNGTNSYIANATGHLYLTVDEADKNIVMRTDDGSGGVANYMILDGGSTIITVHKNFRLDDSVKLLLGGGSDLQIYHDGSNSYIQNEVGDLQIFNKADDKDLILSSDDGSGGTTAYLTLDGSSEIINIAKHMDFNDDVRARFGASGDLQIVHTSDNNYIHSTVSDRDLHLRINDGGSNINAITIDASEVGRVKLPNDNQQLAIGAAGDLALFHDGTDTKIENAVGDLLIYNYADDKDIVLRCDDGSGGTTPYITLDGSAGYTTAQKHIRFDDQVEVQLGAGGDGKIYSYNDDLYVGNETQDKDVYIRANDGGSHGTAIHIDASESRKVRLPNDGQTLSLGAGNDLTFQHDGSNSYIGNGVGHLYISNDTDDGDIVLRSDDGSGGVTPYLTLDGSTVKTLLHEDTVLYATKKLYLDGGGNTYIHEQSGDDLEIVVGGDVLAKFENDTVVLGGGYAVSSSLAFFGQPESPKHMAYGEFTVASEGWYRLARCGTVADEASNGTRASAKFTVYDTDSSRHSAVTFYASGHFGANFNIRILNSSDFSGTHGVIEQIRIVHGSTYEGFGVDVYVKNLGSSAVRYVMEENYQDNGWTAENFAAVDADPPTNMAVTAISCSYDSKNVIDGLAHGNSTTNGAVSWYKLENGTHYLSGSNDYADIRHNKRLRVTTDGGQLDLGAQNSSFAHIQTDRNKFYFNKEIQVDSGVVASYDEDLQLQRASSTDDMIEIEASETKIFGDAVERVKFGSYGIKMENDSDAGGAAGYGVHIGAGNDLMLAHDGTNSFITNKTGHLYVSQSVSNKDIIFMTNDAGNIETPMKIEGSTGAIHIAQPTRFQFANDQRIYDNGSGGLRVGAASHELELYCGGSDPMKFITGGISGNERLRLETAGDLHCDGDVIAASTTISDKRLKDNIITIGNGLSLINQLRGVSFDWNKGSRKGQKDLGLIAQEVEKVLPELVRKKKMALIDDNEYLTVDYDKMVAVLVEAVKEQQVQIEELKEDIKELKK